MSINKNHYSSHFEPISIEKFYNRNLAELDTSDCSQKVVENKHHLLTGEAVLWGMPFTLGRIGEQNNILILKDHPITLEFPEPLKYKYFIFLHAADFKESRPDADGIYRPMMGNPRLGEVAAQYIFQYGDATTFTLPIRRRFNISEFKLNWGENSFECVPHIKPGSKLTSSGEIVRDHTSDSSRGWSQTSVNAAGAYCPMNHWLYAVENPFHDKELKSIILTPCEGTIFLFGITGGNVSENPLKWERQKKLKLTLPDDQNIKGLIDNGNIDIDLGQIISVSPVLDYDNENWENSHNNKQPVKSEKSIIINYTAHRDACIYLGAEPKTIIPLSKVRENEQCENDFTFCSAVSAERRVVFKVLDKESGMPVAVKIHVHGEYGEYIAPMDRRRFPISPWLEDYHPDYANSWHFCAYIDGISEFKLPLGQIYVEVSKGFEIVPVRKSFFIDENTESIVIQIEHVIPWREKGWVSADTHVHVLSPQTALLEAEAEGVNVVNLLATQWGEKFTNVGDFDGKTTLGSKENGGTGEYLVRVGTENRQHILGHISLLGYEGKIILPLTTGGPDESPLGDAVEETLSNWARRCREQKGLSILPHFPNPRAEGAAAMVLQQIDGVEMTSWGDLYGGISPYSLSDWYRYLNCGYHVPAVGGTDKMSNDTAVGTVRTYALIKDKPFTYDNWKETVQKGLTFVTYGPLLEFHVNGQDIGTRLDMPSGGGTLDIDWRISSVTIPVTKVELIVNGETIEVKQLDPSAGESCGYWSVKIERSGWIALRVRGCYPGKSEMIAAHSSAVMVCVDNKRCFNSLDAITILEQIEGATAYVKTLGTQADTRTYKQLLMTLTSAHRALHNHMHQNGTYHNHTVLDDHHQK